MKTTIRRVRKAQAPPKRRKTPAAVQAEQTVGRTLHAKDADSARRTPQLEADALRDSRLVKDLRDNANRSDLTKHRREISATKEDNEDADVEEVEGIVQPDQDTDPAGGVSDTSEVADP